MEKEGVYLPESTRLAGRHAEGESQQWDWIQARQLENGCGAKLGSQPSACGYGRSIVSVHEVAAELEASLLKLGIHSFGQALEDLLASEFRVNEAVVGIAALGWQRLDSPAQQVDVIRIEPGIARKVLADHGKQASAVLSGGDSAGLRLGWVELGCHQLELSSSRPSNLQVRRRLHILHGFD
jgi:hypothetical protein